MDKLKPILEQRFWILSGLAIILTFVGWSMGKSTLAAAIEARRSRLKAAFDSVSGAGANPNEKWTQQIVQRNTLQERELRLSIEQLYQRQQFLKFWPEGISEPARADFTKATQVDLEIYRAKYIDHVEQVRQMIEPLKETDTGELAGKVNFPWERVPNIRTFGAVAPTPQQMYEAQEDLWLSANLYTAIAKINASASGQFDATVREVYELRIRGGDPANIGQSSSAMPDMGGSSYAGAEAGGMPGGPMEMMGQNQAAQYNVGKVEFNPDDEFGPDGSPSGGGGGMRGMDPMMSGSMPADAMGGDPSQSAAPEIKRYIHDTPHYKTRGFYMKVAIDHRRLPDFLTGLSNAPWPIRITRVHQVDMQAEDLAADPSMAGGPGAMPGMPGGSSPAGFPGSGSGSPFPGGAGGIGGSSLGFTGANPLASSSGPGYGSSPAPGLAGGVPGGAESMSATFDPSLSGAAMADPDLAVVAVDGWIVMYMPPVVDPNAQPAADPAATAPAAPAATEAGAAPVADPATTPAAEGTTEPATPADTPATPSPADTPPAEPPPTETVPAETAPTGTVPAGETPKPAEPAKTEPAAAEPVPPPAEPKSD